MKMCQTINQFKKGYQHKFNMIRNKKGELAMNTKERADIWKEYFDKLLNTEEINEFEIEQLTISCKKGIEKFKK